MYGKAPDTTWQVATMAAEAVVKRKKQNDIVAPQSLQLSLLMAHTHVES